MIAGFVGAVTVLVTMLALACAAGALIGGGWLLARLSANPVVGALYVVAGAVWVGVDGPLVVAAAFGLAAMWCARQTRWRWAGILAGLCALVDPGGLILFGVLLVIALRSESNWRSYVAAALAPLLLALGLSAVIMRVPAQGSDLQLIALITTVPLVASAIWGWSDARRDPFVVGVVAWGVLDTLIRVAVLRQPFTSSALILAAGLALLTSSGGRYPWRKYATLALSSSALVLFVASGLTLTISPASARIGIPLEFNLPPERPVQIAYGPDLTLVGVAADTNASTGRRVRIRLTWAVNPERYPSAPLSIHLTFLNRASLPVLSIDDTVPTARWQQAQVVTEHQAIMPGLPPGLLSIYLTVNYQAARLGVERVTRMIVPPGPGTVTQGTQPTIARLANGTRVLAPSIKVEGQSRLKITQSWLSGGPLDQDYKVFLHLMDGTNILRAQYDAEPKQGDYPTSLWQPGDLVVDDGIGLDLSAVPAGEYRLDFGMYADNKRLTMTTCDGNTTDTLALAAVTVTGTIAPDRSVSAKPLAPECDLPPGAPPGTPPLANNGASSG